MIAIESKLRVIKANCFDDEEKRTEVAAEKKRMANSAGNWRKKTLPYLSTPEGYKEAKDSSCTAVIPEGSIFYIPVGYITVLVFYKALETKRRTTSKQVRCCCRLSA